MKAIALLLAAVTAACHAAERKVPVAQETVGADGHSEVPGPYGSWRITELNGSPVQSLTSETAGRPHLTLTEGSYSGSTGCNSFSGTSLVREGRFYAEGPVATERGCGSLTAQEAATFRLLTSGPAVQEPDGETLLLRKGDASMRLRREANAVAQDRVEAPAMLLAGTRWDLVGANGEWLTGPPDGQPKLSFEANRWTFSALCGTARGEWRQRQVGFALLEPGTFPETCRQYAAAAVLRRMLGAPLAYAVGFNRELVLAGAGDFLTGRFDRDFGGDDSALLGGEWRVTAIDGRPPNISPKPPNIIFGRASYAVWDGCNHREGLQLTHARQLFTYGSGLSTLANCLPEQISPKVHAVLGSQPRIARTDKGLALVSSAGRLDLQRTSKRRFGGAERTGLLPGVRIDLALQAGPARLNLKTDRRFAIELGCGALEGDWRPGQPARFSLEPPERHAPACPDGPGSSVFELQRMFGGSVQAATDGNNERVLLLNEDRILVGTVVRQ